jgi:lysophospholipase L1-like esterase
MKLLIKLAVFALASLSSGGAFGQNSFYLKDGDRVVFYGDSITDQRLYTTFVETFTLTRFPDREIEFIHSGWGGDRVTGGGGGPVEVRLRRDVIGFQPTVVTIMLGMNDGRYRAFDPETFTTYTAGYEKMVQALKEALPNARLTLIQPSPYDDVTRPPGFEGGYNAVLLRYGQYVRELAKLRDFDTADLNTPLVTALQRAKEADETLAQKIVPDRVHPGAAGHLLMAAELLKSWSAPSLVTSVEIDGAAGSVAKAANTSVSEVQTGSTLSWIQSDEALPMPLDLKDPVISLALRCSDFVESLDREILKVTGLAAPGYLLKIDDEEVGTFTREALAEGINLALIPTPMARQAAAVHALTLKHNNVRFVRWRQIQVALENDTLVQKFVALNALDALEAELVEQQRAAAEPTPHRYRLTPQEPK